jgi:hypothetical protein
MPVLNQHGCSHHDTAQLLLFGLWCLYLKYILPGLSPVVPSLPLSTCCTRSYNILLDGGFAARVSDFNLSRLSPGGTGMLLANTGERAPKVS